MPVKIKSAREIELMAASGKILEYVLGELEKMIRPGITTMDINHHGEKLIRSYGCVPSFLGYEGFPASICISVNDEVVHGVPSSKRVLKEGDIVSLDAGVLYKGYHSDAARTFGVGKISEKAEQLIRITKESFFEGIKFAKEGNYLFEISAAIGKYAENRGYGVVRDLCGHGIGSELHEEPQVPNHKMGRRGMRLRRGMTLAIEPMLNIGTHEVEWLDNDWTVVSKDGSLSAHYEDTVVITDGEPRLLTKSGEL